MKVRRKTVTAYLDVFDDKVTKLVKQAMKIRKEEHGSKREYAKKLLKEARELRDYVKEIREEIEG